MKDIYEILKFRLGSESYDYEFDIIPIPPYEFLENNLSLEPYEYFGEITEILGYRTKHIILYYNADVLMRVEIKFKGDIIQELIQELSGNFSDYTTTMLLKLHFDEDHNQTAITYQSTKLLR